MPTYTPLVTLLHQHFTLFRPRLNFMAAFIVALLQAATVNLALVANAFPTQASPDSSYRRIQRFLAQVHLDPTALKCLLVSLLPQQNETIVIIDRTDWRFGKTPINILMLSVAFKGIALPIAWKLLDKKGTSNTAERIALVEEVLPLIDRRKLKALLADREFIGEEWFAYLHQKKIPFVIRIKNNTSLGLKERSLKHTLSQLAVGEKKVLRGKRVVFGLPLYVSLLRLATDSVVLVSTVKPKKALVLYRERWQIETMFKAFKTHGFQLEQTHLRDRERLWKLIALMAVAFVWAYRVGHFIAENRKPIRMKKHGRRLYSTFTEGFRFLKRALGQRNQDLLLCFQNLSCT